MEGVLFLVFWLGGAALHTLYDLKVKPVVQTLREESDISYLVSIQRDLSC